MSFGAFGRAALVPAVAIVCMTAVPGCGSKVTQENFDKIHQGMTQTDVHNILGKPDSSETKSGIMGQATEEVWKDGNKKISVIIVNGQVLATEKSGF